jgi:hypothetical protein
MNKQPLRTSDLGLASLLRYLGHNPLSIDLDQPGVVCFEFESTPEAEKIFNTFDFGLKIEVEPCRLFDVFKQTKGMVFRKRDGR